jgi:PAS domain S-box-containing protein
MKKQLAPQKYFESIEKNSNFRILVYEKTSLDQFKIIECNENAVQNSEAKSEEIIGKTLNQLLGNGITSRSLIHLDKNLNICINTKKTVHSEERVFINRKLYIKKNQFIPVYSDTAQPTQILSMSYLTNNLENSKNKLVESQAKFDSFLSTTFAGVLVHQNGTVLSTNNSFLEMFGYIKSEVIGKQIFEKIIKENEQFIIIPKVLNHLNTSYDVNGIKKNGDSIHLQFEGSHFKDHDENIIGIILIRDISKVTKSKTRLIKAQNQLSQFQKIAKIGGWTLQTTSMEVVQSREHRMLFKYLSQKENLTFRDFMMTAIHPDDFKKVQNQFKRDIRSAIQPDFKNQLEFRIINNINQIIWLRVTYFHKSNFEIQGFTQDLTSEKIEVQRAQNKANKSEEIAKNTLKALEFSGVGHFEYSISQKNLQCSQGMKKMLDLDPLTEIKFVDVFQLVNTNERHKVIQQLRSCTKNKNLNEIQFSLGSTHNKVLKIICKATFINTQLDSVFGTIQDVTIIPEMRTTQRPHQKKFQPMV